MLEVFEFQLGSSDVLVLLLEVFPVDDQFHSTGSFFLGRVVSVLEEPQARVRRLLNNGALLRRGFMKSVSILRLRTSSHKINRIIAFIEICERSDHSRRVKYISTGKFIPMTTVSFLFTGTLDSVTLGSSSSEIFSLMMVTIKDVSGIPMLLDQSDSISC